MAMKLSLPLSLSGLILVAAGCATAHSSNSGAINAKTSTEAQASFDLVQTRVFKQGPDLVFQHRVREGVGQLKPNAHGQLAGADVFAYVWPTSLDSAVVGFEANQGILALVLTSHPDFDDTPKYDENIDGIYDNDGDLWHSHWVVLTPDDTCGKGALKVKDIPEGSSPKLPATWPELPIFIDSPGYTPSLQGELAEVRVPQKDVGFPDSFNYDGVTAALRVNSNIHNPLLCVTDVFDIASGDLSLPGKMP